uniref:Chromo domain-containing protein n=1 Tax=Magallana gigas TaxID=29159 RepID=A0A8W8JSJ2_MAGGI
MADNKHYEVGKILDKGIIHENVHYLIRWKGFDSNWDTWEPLGNLVDCLQLVKDFDAKREASSQRLDSVLEAVARGNNNQTPTKKKSKENGKLPERGSPVVKSAASHSHASPKKNSSPKSPQQQSPYKISVKNVKGVKDKKIRQKLARERSKLFIDMKIDTYTPTKNESAQSSGEDEKKKVPIRSLEQGPLPVNSSQRSPKKTETNVSPKKELENDTKSDMKDKEEVSKNVKKKALKDGKKSSDDSPGAKKMKKSDSKTQLSIVKKDKTLKDKGEKPKKSKAAKHKSEEDYCIVECSTSDTDDEPLSNIKVKKSKESSSDSTNNKKKEEKKISPKLKSGQEGNNQSFKVKPKQLTINNVKRKLEVRVQPLGNISKSKKIKLIDSKRDREMATVRPVSPSTSYTTVKPVTISGVGVVNLVVDSDRSVPLCGDVPGTQYIPSVIPISPSSVSYKSLLDNMPLSLLAKKGGSKKKDSDDASEDDQERVERRISVRQSECAYRYKDIVVRKCQRYTQIWLNTHTKIKNVLNPQVIQEIVQALNSAKYDDSSLILFSGLGNVFCNGVDLLFLLSGERRVVVRQMVDALRDFTKALITFPKPVIAVVNGPAVGLGMAMLPLCDIVYASDKATFYLPYSALSQTPEGCASYTLPQSVGMAMANELLLGGRKVTAIEACQLGLVSQVLWPTSMMQEVIPKIQNIALNSAKALETTKLLLRSHQRTKLELTCESESNILLERWQSSECQKSIQAFISNEENYST